MKSPGTHLGSCLPKPTHQYSLISNKLQDFLRLDNPELQELKKKYAEYEQKLMLHSQWDHDFCSQQIEIPYFRGDNAYVWQVRNNNHFKNYQLTTDYLLSIDKLDLFHKTFEDGAFGAFTYRTHNLIVSRDLLDSINELYFLEDNLNISNQLNFKVLDIGAGYGRLAHRFINCFNNIDTYICADAVAESTFLCQFYTQYRTLGDKCKTIPLYSIRESLANYKPNLAVNIHSFSECTLDSIKFWLELLVENNVSYLMIVPNNFNNNGGQELISLERDLSNLHYEHLLDYYGYQLVRKSPKYPTALLQQQGISPTYYYLFALK